MQANSFHQSLQTVMEHARPLGTERVSLHGALGRVLAEDVAALFDDPPAPKSAMDGFALRAAATATAAPGHAVHFPCGETVGAGHLAQAPLPKGEAVRIMTGALLPAGADAVVKLEDCELTAEGRVALTAPLAPGENVVPAGARLKKGDRPLRQGGVVTPQALGMLASLGRGHARFFRRPRVALLALGDELVEPGLPLPPGKLYLSNLYALSALAQQYGADARPLGIAVDNPELILTMLAPRVVRDDSDDPLGCEVIVTVGGSHGGDFDFAEQVLRRLGATIHFRRTRTNLGGSTLFATLDGTVFFGLPGTPVPSWGAFELLVRPGLLQIGGRRDFARPLLAARLGEAYRAQAGRACFAPAWLAFDPGGQAVATPLRERGGGALPPSALANGLIHFPEGAQLVKAGTEVRVEWLAPQ